ncbi:MAG: hypothetical protein JWM41_4283 [Gemmatimonadetes bacterium]|nr:hypothetical protein [Gemmatimonadota bacterium]
MRELWYRLSARLRRSSLDRQLEEEMGFHQDMLARDLERDGLSAQEARGAARRKFGNARALRERSADWWGFPSLEGVLQDIRFGARMLRRSPAFTLVAVGAIGLAIGINAGFFTLVDALVFQPIPVVHPERMVKLLTVDARGWTAIRFSFTDLTTLSTHSRTIEDVVAYDAEPVALRTSANGTGALAASAGLVSANYFTALGGSATVGRALASSDDESGATPAVVISDAFWHRVFAGAPDVVGRDVIVNGSHATIVGVVRPDFVGINPLVPDLWMSLTVAARVGVTPGRLLDPLNRFFALRARLRPGVTIPQAQAELSGLLAEPSAPAGMQAALSRIAGVNVMANASPVPLVGETFMVAAPGLFLVALVLVIACANLANLLLSRALIRQREIAVRLALGASRARLLRQLLTESALIALLGGAVGLLLANWTVSAISRSFFDAMPTALGTVALRLHPSWRVVAYTVGLVCLSVVIFGLAPALYATSPNLTSSLKGEDSAFGTRIRRSHFRDALVSVQVGACVVLLVAAGTLVTSLIKFATTDTGLDVRRVTVARFGLAGREHVSPALATSRGAYAARVAVLPGVAVAARAAQAPFAASWPLLHVSPEGDRGPARSLPYNVITPRYFDVVGQRMVAGRSFTAGDSAAGAKVVIVTAIAAHVLWPGSSALGQSLRVPGLRDNPDEHYLVVGVVADASSGMVWDWDAAGYVFLEASANDFATQDMPLLIRGESGAADLSRALADVALHVDPNSPLRLDRLTDLFVSQLLPFKYAAMIAAGVGGLGLALAVIGLYGIVAFAVTQRRRELAVHVAMGATPRDILRLVLRRELRLVVIGLGSGLVLAFGVARLIGSLMVGLTPLGPAGFVALPIFLLLVAGIATIIPATGALRIAPMQVLRQE